MLDTKCGPKLLNGPLRDLLKVLSKFIDFRTSHVVGLAIVPNELDIIEKFIVGIVLALIQIFLFY